MKSLIRKILKESNNEWDWVRDIKPSLTMSDLLNPNFDISTLPETSFKNSIGKTYIITYDNGKILIYDPQLPVDYIDNGAYWDWDELRKIFISGDYGWTLDNPIITENLKNDFDWVKSIPGEIDWDSPSVPSNMVTISFRTAKGNGDLYQLIHSHGDVFYVSFYGENDTNKSIPWKWSRISKLFRDGEWVRVNTLKESEGEWDWVKDIPELSYDTLKKGDKVIIKIPNKENFIQKFIRCDFTRGNLSDVVDLINQGYPVVVLNIEDEFSGQEVYCNGDYDDLNLLSFELSLTVKDHFFTYGNSIDIWVTQEDFEIVGYSSK